MDSNVDGNDMNGHMNITLGNDLNRTLFMYSNDNDNDYDRELWCWRYYYVI